MNDSSYLRRLLWMLLAGITLLVAFIYVVDPFQVYHKPFWGSMNLNENQRYQNAGLINSYLSDPGQGYDSVAIGASVSVNFTGKQLAETLHWQKPLRLFLNGASAAEIREITTKALATGNVHHILLEQDIWSMKGVYDAADDPAFPRYLYNANQWDDIKYFADTVVFQEALKKVFGLTEVEHATPDMLGYWADRDWVDDLHAQLNDKAFIASLDAPQAPLLPRSENKIASFQYPAIDNEMAPLLRQLCNTDVEVALFIPPAAAMNYRINRKIVYPVIYEVRYLLKIIDGCSNIRLHAFDTLDFTADLNNYKDRRHYLPHVNAQMLHWIYNREHTVSLDAIENYEKEWMNKITTRKITSSYPAPPKIAP